MPSSRNKKKRPVFFVVIALAFTLAWLGLMMVFFPVGNPLKTVGGTSGEGIIFAILFGVAITFCVLIFYAVRSSIKDLLVSVGNDLGIDVLEITRQYRQIVKDELLVILRRKDRPSDHHDE